MLPPRASLPTSPVPGSSGRSSSSSTTASRPAFTVGPPALWLMTSSLVMTTMPFMPLSEDPMASTMMMFGSSSNMRCFSEGEKIAALDDSTNSDERSHRSGSRSSASVRGRAMASPVMTSVETRSRSTASQIASAENLGTNTTVLPSKKKRSAPHWAAPCMSGGALRVTIGASDAAAFSASCMPWVTRSLV